MPGSACRNGLGDERHGGCGSCIAPLSTCEHLLYILVAGLQTGLLQSRYTSRRSSPRMKLFQLGGRQTQLVLVDVAGNVGNQCVELARIHLSSMVRSAGSWTALSLSMVRFIWIKRDAFQILLQKCGCLYALIRETHVVSRAVTGCEVTRHPPYWSMTSGGSMPLPSDLDILRPVHRADRGYKPSRTGFRHVLHTRRKSCRQPRRR